MTGVHSNPENSLPLLLAAALKAEAETQNTDLFKICSKFKNPVIVNLLIAKVCKAYTDVRDETNSMPEAAGKNFIDAIMAIRLNPNDDDFSLKVAEFAVDAINYIYKNAETFKPLLLKLVTSNDSDNMKFAKIKQGMEGVMREFSWLEKQVIEVHHESKHHLVKHRKALTPTHSKAELGVDQKKLQASASAASFTLHGTKPLPVKSKAQAASSIKRKLK